MRKTQLHCYKNAAVIDTLQFSIFHELHEEGEPPKVLTVGARTTGIYSIWKHLRK